MQPPTPASAASPSLPDLGDPRGSWAVVGAGPHGLAALKALRQLGITAHGYEQSSEVGGNWNFGGTTARVYESTHLISTKPFTQFPDFPMPSDYPDYPSHRQVLAYFQRYARHFGLYEQITFGSRVVDVRPQPDGVAVTVCDRVSGLESTHHHAGVVIANGHNWSPRTPVYPGHDNFTGDIIHSADYRTADQVKGRRVLVVGGGNTGCDIAVESGQHAVVTLHSTRRGYRYSPKYAFGVPSDQVADLLLALRVPLALRRRLFDTVLRLTVGNLTRFGLPKPDHAFFETHPTVNQQLPYAIGHGMVRPKPDIARFEPDGVLFVDGSVEKVDLVVFATGYEATFPFLAPGLLGLDPTDSAAAGGADDPTEAPGADSTREEPAGDLLTPSAPVLARQMFFPGHPTMVVSGLIQPDSGQWTIAHWQAMLIAQYAAARRDRPQVAQRFNDRLAQEVDKRYSGGAEYASSDRHRFEVAHQDYLRVLQDDIHELEGSR